MHVTLTDTNIADIKPQKPQKPLKKPPFLGVKELEVKITSEQLDQKCIYNVVQRALTNAGDSGNTGPVRPVLVPITRLGQEDQWLLEQLQHELDSKRFEAKPAIQLEIEAAAKRALQITPSDEVKNDIMSLNNNSIALQNSNKAAILNQLRQQGLWKQVQLFSRVCSSVISLKRLVTLLKLRDASLFDLLTERAGDEEGLRQEIQEQKMDFIDIIKIQQAVQGCGDWTEACRVAGEIDRQGAESAVLFWALSV